MALRLVFVTQLVDADDAVLGFALGQIRALRDEVDELVVVANEVRDVPVDLDVEVVSLGKERGRGTATRGAVYTAELARRASRKRPLTLLAHMCPVYLTVAAPVLRATDGRSMLWFCHPANTPTLRRAERLADVVLTPSASTYPRPGPKVRLIGHAVDVDRFSPASMPDGVLRILAVGRTSPVKGYEAVLDAAAKARAAGAELLLDIVGPSTTDAERRHRRELLDRIAALDLGSVVRLRDAVAHAEVPALLRDAHVVVNATRAGSADKAVYEAMAAGRPVLACAPAFAPMLERADPRLCFTEGDADGLAERFVALASLPRAQLERIGSVLRAEVVAGHSMRGWASAVAGTARELRQGRHGGR